jgi:hypothetical protein
MKNCIFCLSILILSSLAACSGFEELESKSAQLKTINPATRLGQVEEDTTNTSMDSILAIKVAEEEQNARLELAIERTKVLKKAYDERTEETENYVESIPFLTFLDHPIEYGALEIIQFGDQYTRIYADYFDGEPVGGKLYFIQNNALIAIEIIQLKEKVTETGASIKEESTHLLYYNEEVLLSAIDLSTNEAVEANSVVWLDENLADWKLVKTHINTL